jgi:hypothetical protein
MSGVLPNWLERLLGLEAESGQGTAWRLDSTWGWAPWVTLLFVVLTVGLVVFVYSKESAGISRRTRAILVSLRLAVVGLLLFMIAEFMISFQRTGLPHVVVIVDESASMGIADRYRDEKLLDRLSARLQAVGLEKPTRLNLAKLLLLEDDARLLTSIESGYKLRVYFLSGAARLQSGEVAALAEEIQSLDASGDASRLGAGLREVLSDLRGTPPAAIILLTDGVTTDGEPLTEVAAYARRKGVPLFPVGLGSDEPVRDIELSDLLVNEVVFVDDVVNFQAKLSAQGYPGREARVVLKEKGNPRVLAETKVKLPADGESEDIRLAHRPSKVGEFEYIVEVDPFDEEAQLDNNAARRIVSVRKEQIRVLMVQAYPNYEWRFLKTMFERDPTIEFRTVLQDADLDYAALDQSALRVFPVRRDELFEYDVLIFGDVNPAFLSASVMNNISDFVKVKGGGLVFIAGPQYTPLAFRDTPLAPLMPIDLGAARLPPEGEVASEGFSPVPTDLGQTSGPLQLGDSPAETAQIWAKLPPLYWLLEVGLTKRGATVLAEHPTRLGADGRKLPVILMQYVDAGKVLFHATDETWRWRYRLGDVLLARYWVQTVRYLARAKLLGGDGGAELTVDRREYRRGEPVRIRIRFVDERKAPAADDGVTVTIEQQGSQSRRLKLHRHATSRGVFEGIFTGASEGAFHVWMATPTVEGRAPSADFRVEAPPGEFEHVQMDVAELSRTAEISHGKFYRITNANNLLGDLPVGRQIPVEALPPEVLWNRWWVFLLFLGLLVSEWILRKRKGLL